jgi:hypothetical protein
LYAQGNNAINGIQSDSGWHLLAEYPFPGDEGGTAQSDETVEALLGESLASLGLPAALLQAVSSRLILALTQSKRINPSMPVSIRLYNQEPGDWDSHPGNNSWGHFLVERRIDRPGDPEGVIEYSIEAYLYSEGQTR